MDRSGREDTALAKMLVATVARAFYTDSYVILLDALIREPYIVFQEIAPRLGMHERDVVGIVSVLEKEGMIKSQNVTFHDASW